MDMLFSITDGYSLRGASRRLSEGPPGKGTEGGILSGVDIIATTLDLFLVQAVIIIAMTRILAVAGAYLKQPRVIFEVIGGILLGPSAIGRNTDYLNRIFPPQSLGYIGLVANFGLLLYLFLVGLELDPKLLASHVKRAGAVAIVGMIVPFCLGIAVSQTLFDNLMGGDPKYANVSFTAFFVFIGTAMSITAFPVLARILRETGLIYTRAGSLAMGAAALGDAVAWCLLILAISIANAGDMATAGYVFACVVAFALVLFLLVAPLFYRLVMYIESLDDSTMRGNLFAFTLVIMFLCSWTTDLLGVHSIFGAFLFGLIVPRDTHLFHMCEDKIGEFVMTIMLPLYFALSGLKTDVTQIQTGEDGAMVILVCVVASVGKLVGAGVPALAGGLNFRETSVVAVLMNTRGLVELIVLNLGLSSGVMNSRVFAVMVIMCLFTTFITCPIISYIYPPHLRVLEDTKPTEIKVASIQGDEAAEQADDHDFEQGEADVAISPHRFDSLGLSVIVDKMEQIPSLMAVLLLLSPKNDSHKLATRMLRLVEPTKSDKDKFLFATDHGRLIAVEAEPTTMPKEDPTSTAPKPELLSLSLFCTTIGSHVDASRIIGDTNEFATEIKRLSDESAVDMVVMPWRESQYNEKIIWSTIFKLSVPVALILDTGLYADENKSGPHCLRDILVLVTFAATDAALLQMAIRMLHGKGANVTIIVPGDIDDFCQPRLRQLIFDIDALAQVYSNLAVNFLGFSHTSIDAYYRECASNVYDLILVSFTEPLLEMPALESPAPPLERTARSRSRAGTLSAMVEALVPSGPDETMFRRSLGLPMNIINGGATHPELGVLVERLYTLKIAAMIMLVHPHRDVDGAMMFGPITRKMSMLTDDDYHINTHSPKRHLSHENSKHSGREIAHVSPESSSRHASGAAARDGRTVTLSSITEIKEGEERLRQEDVNEEEEEDEDTPVEEVRKENISENI